MAKTSPGEVHVELAVYVGGEEVFGRYPPSVEDGANYGVIEFTLMVNRKLPA